MHPDLLSRTSSRLLVVDMQGKILPRIHGHERLTATCRRLAEGAKILGVPAFATEQYPQGLGPTVPALAEILPTPIQKLRFSCGECLAWGTAGEQDRFQVVVTGIEAHVCVLQTVLDLLSQGYGVFVPADAVSSRRELDAGIALQRMAAAGASIVTSESVLFEWCEVSGTPEFKEISRLVKEAEV